MEGVVMEYPEEEAHAIETNKTISRDSEENKVCEFYLEGKCVFGDNCFNVHVGNIKQNVDKKNKTKDNRCKDKVNTTSIEEKPLGKKPPLRTAGDVRKRIQWDVSLQGEHFTVGYLDRFEGIMEKPFSAFTWEDLADAEIDDLAIPQHRIHYYKYKGRKVWDKNERLDHVFGSAGNTKNIYDVISEMEEQLRVKGDDLEFDEISSDSDDDVVVVSSSLSPETTKALISATKKRVHDISKLRATHFLCIRIRNDALADEVRRVQETVIKGDPLLRSCAMPGEILHITLAMIRCESETAIDSVSTFLTELREEITNSNNYKDKNVIIAKNLSTFGSRVLYSKLEISPLFTEVVDILQKKLGRLEGVTITNQFDFVPHMTLLKVNRYIAKERRSRYIDSCLYQEYLSKEFGEIKFDNIHFCIINDYRGQDGFYLTCAKTEF